MEGGSHMNFVALNQNIFNKSMVIGSGPKEGISKEPIVTAKSLKVYLNGTHAMPSHGELENGITIGEMKHPYAMAGMPDCSGNLSYEFWTTKEEYLIIIRLKLDEFSNGPSEAAADLLALIKRDQLPDNLEDSEENYEAIAKEMMFCHFDSLFEFYDNIEGMSDWTFEDDVLHSIIQNYFELNKA